MITYKNKLSPTQLKSLYTMFNLITQRQIIYVNSISSYNANLDKANKLKTLLDHFLCCLSYGCVTHHSPGMNTKISGTRLILSLCPEYCVFTSPRVEGWTTKIHVL